MTLKAIFLGMALLFASGSGAYASFSALDAAPSLFTTTEMVQLSDDLKVLESVAASWAPEWRHDMPKEEAVALAERTVRKIDDLLSKNQLPAGELLLLKGLAATYGYNLDQEKYFGVAVDALQKARKAIPSDCRPLWILGNHYTKAADAENGVPLLQQAVHQCGDKLPLAFWEDYAYAALLAAMPATGNYALDQVKFKNGGIIPEEVKTVQEGLRKRLVAPEPQKRYEPEEVWRTDKGEKSVRVINDMYGFMLELPVGDWGMAPFGVRNSGSGIGIRLPKKGKWPPPLEVAIFVSPAAKEMDLEKELRGFLATVERRNLTSVPGPMASSSAKFMWLQSKQKKGSQVLAGILRRPQPAYPGLLLESPHNVPKGEDTRHEPRYYRAVEQLTRLPGDLDYIIMIEGAPSAFEKGRADMELFLRNLVIE